MIYMIERDGNIEKGLTKTACFGDFGCEDAVGGAEHGGADDEGVLDVWEPGAEFAAGLVCHCGWVHWI